MPSDFPGEFAALRDILKKHADDMVVLKDTPTDFTVTTRAKVRDDKPVWFGCVLAKKSAVTYHLFPLYFNPKLQAAVAPQLLPRKQGKTCFNFQRPDPVLFAHLDDLTKLSREALERSGFLAAGPVAPEQLATALRAGGEDPEALAKLRKAKGQAAAKKRAATIKRKRVVQGAKPTKGRR